MDPLILFLRQRQHATLKLNFQLAAVCDMSATTFDDDDDDDDDCQFVEHSIIHGKARFIANTGVVSLPDDKQQKSRTEKRMKRWIMVQSQV